MVMARAKMPACMASIAMYHKGKKATREKHPKKSNSMEEEGGVVICPGDTRRKKETTRTGKAYGAG